MRRMSPLSSSSSSLLSFPFFLLFFVLFLFSSAPPVNSQVVSLAKAKIFSTIFSQYDNLERPLRNSSLPDIVTVQYRLNLLYGVDSQTETFQMDFFLTESWIDARLQFDKSWWPDFAKDSLLRVPNDLPCNNNIIIINNTIIYQPPHFSSLPSSSFVY